eukprot:865553-Pleurochrysis_carterae.AAC.3
MGSENGCEPEMKVPSLGKRPWSSDEDAALLAAVEKCATEPSMLLAGVIQHGFCCPVDFTALSKLVWSVPLVHDRHAPLVGKNRKAGEPRVESLSMSSCCFAPCYQSLPAHFRPLFFRLSDPSVWFSVPRALEQPFVPKREEGGVDERRG